MTEKYIYEKQTRQRKNGPVVYRVRRKTQEVCCEKCGEKWLIRQDRLTPQFCRSCKISGERNPRYGKTEWKNEDVPTVGKSTVELREKNNLIRWKRKKLLIKHMGDRCYRCKKKYPICVYQWHHVNPKDKKIEMSKILLRGWNIVEEEMEKCVLVCSNCRKTIH